MRWTCFLRWDGDLCCVLLMDRIFCDLVPNASFNFLALAASNYYDNTRFHRNIKGFITQAGDPTGTGKGGESIWGKPFIDEFHPDLRHGKVFANEEIPFTIIIFFFFNDI